MEQVKDVKLVKETCDCGKLLADCQCARGEVCECGGDTSLCQSKNSAPQMITVSLSTPFARK
jgi:hypothetical protein